MSNQSESCAGAQIVIAIPSVVLEISWSVRKPVILSASGLIEEIIQIINSCLGEVKENSLQYRLGNLISHGLKVCLVEFEKLKKVRVSQSMLKDIIKSLATALHKNFVKIKNSTLVREVFKKNSFCSVYCQSQRTHKRAITNKLITAVKIVLIRHHI